MKNRIFALVLVLAMVASLVVMPVSAEANTPSVTATSDTCPCGCGKELSAATWQVYDPNTNEAPSTGHYYLDGNYVQDKQYTIMAGDRVVLDLRGHTLTTETYARLLLVYGYFYVVDTVGGGRFMSKTSGTALGGVVMVSTNENNDALFQLCSGTITRDDTNKGGRRGGLVYVNASASFRMTGGMLLNGTTVSTANPDSTGSGGCIAALDEESTVEILGGQIIGGESSTYGGNIYAEGTLILKNCQIIGGTAAQAGGNVYASGSVTVENCVIKDGVSNQSNGNGGGNICVSGGATLSMKDSTVRNGWARYHGGNVFIGTAEATIENCAIEAGVARNRGGNLYGYKDATGLTLRNCSFPGDIAYVGAGLKLEGLVKIGLLNYGLRLRFGTEQAAPLDASGLTEGSEIFVNAKDTFTTADVEPSYFKGCNRVVVTESAEGLVAALAASGELGGYCPHCNERVVWTKFDPTGSLVQQCYNDKADGADTDPACTGNHLESGHYFLSASQTSLTRLYVGAYYDLTDVKDVVLDMAGYSITAPGRAFYVRGDSTAQEQSTLTILDSYGNSKITGSGSNNQSGGVIYNDGGNLVIYGSTYIYAPVEGRNVTGAAVILNGKSLTIHGGTLDASAFTYTVTPYEKDGQTVTPDYYGGCVRQYKGTKYTFTMTAGRLIGGTVQSGGCAYFDTDNQVHITGGQFDSGIAKESSGGCIRMCNSSDTTYEAQFSMSGASVRNGRAEAATGGGGNLIITNTKTTSISDSYIAGGYSGNYGGNLVTGVKSNITLTNCILEGGYAVDQGGNAHHPSTNTYVTWDNCQVLNGSATYGGNLNAANGYLTYKGGQYLFGKARTSYGGNLSATSGNASTTTKNFNRFVADEEGDLPLIAQGYAKTYGGNIYGNGNLELLEAKVVNGLADKHGQDLLMSKGSNQSKLTVGEGLTGTLYVGFSSSLLGQEVYGAVIDRTVCQQVNATMILEGDEYQGALLCAKDGQLYVGGYAVVDGADNMTWYADAASALANCPEGSYVKLFLDAQVTLTKDAALDIYGNQVTVSGPYTAYLMDAKGGGTVTLTQGAQTEPSYIAPNGVHYLTKEDAGTYTAHPLDMKITGISLRTGAAGMYYTGSWIGDEVTSAMVESYGVALSTAVIPDETFMDENSKCLWTKETDTLTRDTTEYSVLVGGIMKTLAEDADRTAEENRKNGDTKINAVAYVKLSDGGMLLSDCVSYSLHDLMGMVDERILTDSVNYRKYTNQMRDFYSQWQDFGMGQWRFDKIEPPVEDDVIELLMIGNSFCSYYVQELAAMAAADGIQMRVCNVYYSGCRMDQHYNWWLAGEAPYQFYETTAGKDRIGTPNVSLEWCLAQGEWDFISLQTARHLTYDMDVEIERNKPYMDTLVGYLREQFPNAKLAWHQTWTYEIGTASNGVETDAASQLANHERILNYSLHACEEYDLIRVNTGDAWKVLRDEGYRKLCYRLGKKVGDAPNHTGDNYHDGDIGGGQYLNACVWYEVLTGNSCLGNTYRPVYTYNGVEYPLESDMTYERLQEVAHQVVAEMRAAEAENQ